MSITTAFRGFLERIVFADSLENVLAIATADELDGWRDGRGGDFAHFLRLADSLALTGLGRGTGLMMSYGAYHGIDGESFPRGLFSQRAIRRTAAADADHRGRLACLDAGFLCGSRP
ncbi:hypothetical protein [Bradyrhizobium hipponense]|uniref:hypothetical protein n=1 Tax=Bradyrhizobium hipponense TaxID=2605638 RepID=UPI003221F1DF